MELRTKKSAGEANLLLKKYKCSAWEFGMIHDGLRWSIMAWDVRHHGSYLI
jgi:hypothetical protein